MWQRRTLVDHNIKKKQKNMICLGLFSEINACSSSYSSPQTLKNNAKLTWTPSTSRKPHRPWVSKNWPATEKMPSRNRATFRDWSDRFIRKMWLFFLDPMILSFLMIPRNFEPSREKFNRSYCSYYSLFWGGAWHPSQVELPTVFLPDSGAKFHDMRMDLVLNCFGWTKTNAHQSWCISLERLKEWL